MSRKKTYTIKAFDSGWHKDAQDKVITIKSYMLMKIIVFMYRFLYDCVDVTIH